MAQRLRGGSAAKARAPRQGRRYREGQKQQWSYWPETETWAAQDTAWWGGLGLAPPSSAPWPAAEAADGPEAEGSAEGPAEEGSPEAAKATESLLDALAPGAQQPAARGPRGKQASAKRSWVVAAERPVSEAGSGLLTPENLLGYWVDSQGNSVHVLSTDAYNVRLEATLSRPPRADIHLSVRPVMLGAGWQCGHSLLDPMWTTAGQLHWVAMDGRVSVWVRPQEGAQQEEAAEAASDGHEQETAEEPKEGATAEAAEAAPTTSEPADEPSKTAAE